MKKYYGLDSLVSVATALGRILEGAWRQKVKAINNWAEKANGISPGNKANSVYRALKEQQECCDHLRAVNRELEDKNKELVSGMEQLARELIDAKSIQPNQDFLILKSRNEFLETDRARLGRDLEISQMAINDLGTRAREMERSQNAIRAIFEALREFGAREQEEQDD